MDLYIKNSINIVPVIAIDFSLANLTFDDKMYCAHTLKQGVPNDYIECLKSVSKSFYYFSRFMLAYGFGACPFINGDGPSCNLISLTGDFIDPYVDNAD
jgi:hypothetical protein